jgi:hypothetical protein
MDLRGSSNKSSIGSTPRLMRAVWLAHTADLEGRLPRPWPPDASSTASSERGVAADVRGWRLPPTANSVEFRLSHSRSPGSSRPKRSEAGAPARFTQVV